MKKAELVEIVNDLPDDADVDIDKLIYTLWVRRKIERALADAEHDEGISHEEFVRESDAWLD